TARLLIAPGLDIDREGIVAARFAAVLDDDGKRVCRASALLLDRTPECRSFARYTRRLGARGDGIDHEGTDSDAVIGRFRRLVVVFELPLERACLRIALHVETEVGGARRVDDVDLAAARHFAFRHLAGAHAGVTRVICRALVEVVAASTVWRVGLRTDSAQR